MWVGNDRPLLNSSKERIIKEKMRAYGCVSVGIGNKYKYGKKIKI
jgi:hypothetical protein